MAAADTGSILPEGLLAAVSDFLPTFFTALLILLLGWLLARLLRELTARVLAGIYRLIRRFRPAARSDEGAIRPPSRHLAPRLVYWFTLIVFAGFAARTLGFAVVGDWLEAALAHLPALVAGIAIVVVGLIGSEFAREVTTRGAAAAHIGHGETVGRSVQVAVIAVALVVGADQIGIDVSLLHSLFVVVLTALLGGLALSFGLASPLHVDNYMSARYLRRHFSEGDTVRIGDCRGRIVDISSHAVILETEEGELHIPATRFTREPTLKVIREAGDA